MKKHTKNINIDRDNFPLRLRRLREERHLSKGDLAELSGLTYRTIHDIEQGKRTRLQEKTLLLIARALELSLEELLNGDPPPGKEVPHRATPSLWIRAAVVVGLALVAGFVFVWFFGISRASWTLEDRHLTARHGILGFQLWTSPPDTPVTYCRQSPWDPGCLVLAIDRTAPGGGAVRCVKRSNGEVLWSVGPDIDALVAAFGAEVVLSAGFSARIYGFPDLEGDGEHEVLVRFTHGRFYPTAICLVDRHGVRRSQYATKGHVLDLRIVDLDGDGRDEIVGGGTNNAPAYQSAMLFILDAGHASGATIDDECDPWSTVPDSALVRIVLPKMPEPYMGLMGGTRLAAFEVQAFQNNEGEARLSAAIGGTDDQLRFLVHFDEKLRPVGAEPTDRFRELALKTWPDSLTAGTGPTDPVWLARWLQGARHFEAGHWPPKTPGD